MKKLIFARRASQTFFLLLFVYILWSTTYPLKGLISPQVIFKIDPLIVFLTALSERFVIAGFIFSLAMVALTLLLGRFFCGWICPMGTSIDAFGALIRVKRQDLTSKQKITISRPKFFVLAAMILFALAGLQAAWTLDPIVITGRVVSLNMIPALTLAVDNTFQFFIQKFGLYGVPYDLYRALKAGILGVNVHFFSNSLLTLFFFLAACLATGLILRLWCRMLCPLGALYALSALPAFLRRQVKGCTGCGACVERCRMGAIKSGTRYRAGECILCMDCVYDCPEKAIKFSWGKAKPPKPVNAKGMTRSQFLFLLGSFFALAGFKFLPAKPAGGRPVIRPPGALPEAQFVNTCVRCGNCMKVCITNGLQPAGPEARVQGLWTPKLIPEIGYCEYNCKLCGEVCPTGAIAPLPVEEKKKTRLGVAEIDRGICFAWAENKQCIVCEEHCPVPTKAITTITETVDGKKVLKPVVNEERCIGCGICQNKCPVRPIRAIRVDPRRAS